MYLLSLTHPVSVCMSVSFSIVWAAPEKETNVGGEFGSIPDLYGACYRGHRLPNFGSLTALRRLSSPSSTMGIS